MPLTPTRTTPPVKRLRVLFSKYPARSNAEWAREWGVSRERVRQLRAQLGLAPFSQIQRQIRAETREHRKADETMNRARLSDRICAVCNRLLPALRRVTCSPKCARRYQSSSRYRV